MDNRPLQAFRMLRMSRGDRAAARAERRAEAAIRAERDNLESAERRAAALEAERRRYPTYYGGGM